MNFISIICIYASVSFQEMVMRHTRAASEQTNLPRNYYWLPGKIKQRKVMNSTFLIVMMYFSRTAWF